MRLHDVMTTDVQSVGPDQDLAAAATLMKMQKMHHLVVMDGRQVVGILSDRDIARGGHRVRDVMTDHPLMATPTTPLRRAANLMRGHVIGCLPVVDEGRLVGIVTISDLLEALGRASERPVERGKRWTLKHRGPRKHRRG